MVIYLLILAVSCFFSVFAGPAVKSFVPKKLIFVDGIKAVFRGSDGVDLIMHSEVNRLKLDGTPTTLPDLITDLALGQEAKKYRLWPSPEEVDKQRRMLCESNKKTPKEFDELLLTIGYTPEEGWHTFAQINAINSLVGYKITGNLIVPESEVEAYYNENPEYQEASYQLQYVVVPYRQSGSKEKQLQQLKALALAGDQKNTLNWGEPFWIKENEVASDKQFITDLPVGAVSEPISMPDGFELFRLKNKKESRTRTLDERYGQIVNILRRPKYDELMEKFKKDLLGNASIIYFDLPLAAH